MTLSEGRMARCYVVFQEVIVFVYKSGGLISMRPLLDEEIIFTPTAVVQFLTDLGYRIQRPSDNMISSV